MNRKHVQATPPPVSRREELARTWTHTATSSAYIPRAVTEIERLLLELVDELLAALDGDEPTTSAGARIGARLVKEGFIDPHALRATVDVLSDGLLADIEDTPDTKLAQRIVALLGALSAGYAAGLRDYTLTEQERVKQALFNAVVRAEHDLRATENRFREVFASSAVGIAITDLNGMCIEANPALSQILACPPGQLDGRMLSEFILDEHAGEPATEHPRAADQPPSSTLGESYRQVLVGEAERVREHRGLRTADGETAWALVGISLLHDGAGDPAYFVTMVQDTSELQLLTDRLSHQLLYDALTGMPNRQHFHSKLETTLGRTGSAGSVTLCLVNLDGFAVVNNGLGHHVGDRLLQTVGQRLERAVDTERALVARLGGDEFAVLVEDSPATPDIGELIDTINTALGEPEYIEGHGVSVGASIGAVRCRAEEMSAAELFRAADTALRKAKATGRRQWAGFHARDDGPARQRDVLATELPAAWENGQLTVAYEPVVPLGGDERRAVAARPVLSWDRLGDEPQLRHRDCLALAERTGLSVQLGPHMLSEACAHLSELRSVLGQPPGPLVRLQLTRQQSGDADLARAVHKAVADTTASPGLLEIALDTGAVLDDFGDARDNLLVLGDIGVRTGLCEFHGGPRELDLLTDSPAGSVTLAVAGPGAAARQDAGTVLRAETERLVASVVAGDRECSVLDVRTDAEAAWWTAAGATSAQGGVFGPPVAVADLATLAVPGHAQPPVTAG